MQDAGGILGMRRTTVRLYDMDDCVEMVGHDDIIA